MNTQELAKKIIAGPLITSDTATLFKLRAMKKHGFVQKRKNYYEGDYFVNEYIPTAKLYKRFGR